MRLVIGSDHAGFVLKRAVLEHLAALGHSVEDVGGYDDNPVDFPDIARKIGAAITGGRAERGLMVCGTGVGAAIAANKMRGIRAAVCHDVHSAHQCVEHDDVNVMCIGAQIVGGWLAKDLITAYLGATFSTDTDFRRRVDKLAAMDRESGIRAGEMAVTAPPPTDAGLVFIGRIHTPWTSRLVTPRQGRPDGPLCRIEVFAPWVPALDGLQAHERIEVLYWLHQSRRDLVQQSPANDGTVRGTFAIRSPVRPNPIGTSVVRLVGIEGAVLLVRGLDCLDGTPLLDLKPDRSRFNPSAPPHAGDSQVGDE